MRYTRTPSTLPWMSGEGGVLRTSWGFRMFGEVRCFGDVFWTLLGRALLNTPRSWARFATSHGILAFFQIRELISKKLVWQI